MKEIITTPLVSTPVRSGATNNETLEYIIYFLFGTLDILLVFRLILKLAGASTSSSFVNLIYAITSIFTMPFNGIFSKGYAQITNTTSVLEPATIVAIFVYALLSWGIVKLIRITSGEKQTS